MILMLFLLAPTVPSEPRPKNTARNTRSDSVANERSTARLVRETSSVMPTVKWLRGAAADSSSNTALAMAGVNSFDDRP